MTRYRTEEYASNDKSSQQTDRKPSVRAWKQIRERQQSRKSRGKPSTFSQKRPRALNRVNGNYYLKCATGLKDCACVPGQLGLNPSPMISSKSETVNLLINSLLYLLYTKCSFCYRVAAKERRKSQLLSQVHRNKICERCFICRSLEFCKSCHKCLNCCHRSTCRGKATPVLGKMGSPWGESKGSNSTQRGLHPPLPVQTQSIQITNCRKQLYQPSQKSQPFGGPVSAGEQKCSRTGGKSKLPGVLQPAIFGTQTQQPVETYLGPEHLQHLPKHRVVQNGDPRDSKNLPEDRGVGNFHRFQRHILPHTNSQSVQEVHAFSCPGSLLPIQSPTLWPVHSTHGVHSGGQRGV